VGGAGAATPRGGINQTAPLPKAGGPGEPPTRWAARAGVPVRGPREAAPQEPVWLPEEPGRIWWAPILIGLIVLMLLGLIGLGLWLALRSHPGPAPSTSANPTVSASSASPSASPSPSPTASTAPSTVTVPVPALGNIAVSDAEQILQSQGLTARVVNRVSDALPPGTVLDTDPPAGTVVPAGSQITLFVAVAPASSSPPESPSPSTSVSAASDSSSASPSP
jgi:hypothetical protein